MDVETAKAMLGLLLGKHWALFGSFHQFIEVSVSSFHQCTLNLGRGFVGEGGGDWLLLRGPNNYTEIKFQNL